MIVKYSLISLILISVCIAQEKTEIQGSVTYKSSQNVYVQFPSTEGILAGDTLFLKTSGNLEPAVIVKFISSRSAAGEVITEKDLLVNTELIAFVIKVQVVEEKETVKLPSDSISTVDGNAQTKIVRKIPDKKLLRGRFSVQSFSGKNNFTGDKWDQRWRYTLSLNSEEIAQSNISLSAYLNFYYKAEEWHEIKNDFGKSFRIYDLSVKYKVDETFSVWLGRHLNRKITNISSVDGVQAEKYFGNFYAGVIAGSRPDFTNMGFNLKLFEFGGYAGKTDSLNGRFMENTVAAIQQTNDFKTDRRFIYFQHTNNFIPNTSVFFTSETDLYKRVSGKGENTLSITGVYLSARYSPFSLFSVSLSYDARKNVIYYETFKSFTDSLIENTARQGFRIRTDIRPFKNTTSGFSAGYRFSKTDIKPSRNFSGYISQHNLPLINISATLSYNKIISSYVDGDIVSFNLQKSTSSGLSIGAGYRKTMYTFSAAQSKTEQDDINISINTRIFNMLFFGFSFEGTYENKRTYNRYLINFTTKF